MEPAEDLAAVEDIRAAAKKAVKERSQRRMKAKAKAKAAADVPKNAKGGIKVDEDELKAAFQFFDVNGTGKITIQTLKKRLAPFYKRMQPREFKFLMGGNKEITLDDLRALIFDNEISNFDPVAEAFKVYDPDGTGIADPESMRRIFEKLGFDDLTDEDMDILVDTADVDKDGKVSLADFRAMLTLGRKEGGSSGGSGGGAGAGAMY